MKTFSDLRPDPFIVQSAERCYRKMKISKSERDFGIRVITAFFDVKNRNRNLTLILPQVADWIWHEMVSDTVAYRAFGERLNTFFNGEHISLNHITSDSSVPQHQYVTLNHQFIDQNNGSQIVGNNTRSHRNNRYQIKPAYSLEDAEHDPRGTFLWTAEFFKREYGLDFRTMSWMDAGWDSPPYRLRNEHGSTFRHIKFSSSEKEAISLARQKVSFAVKARELGWVKDRLMRRFPVSEDSAELATTAYCILLDRRRETFATFVSCPPLIEWAHFEHVLWTSRVQPPLYGPL